MRFIRVLFLLSLGMYLVACQEVEPSPALDSLVFIENETKGNLELNLTWTVNGVKDDGMLADLSIYLSESQEIDVWALDETLSAVNFSNFDYYGGTRMAPTKRSLPDFYRYYIGVAFNGILPSPQSVTYPLTISYTLKVYLENAPDEGKIITGSMVITTADLTKTKVVYPYTLDINESKDDAEYKSYSLRQLETPILVTRVSDIENTDTFSSTKSLFIDMVWKVNGVAKGFSHADLDMFLHDTNNTNIQNFDELDFSSASSDSYEKIQVDASSTLLKAGVPEKIGFYFFEKKAATELATVEYMYKIYSYDGKIKRFTVYGSFTSPPIMEDDGSFYFGAAITKTNATYKVQKLTPVVKWLP